MKIRKFVAPSVPQALRQVRDDLGDQAVILNTRQIPGENGRQHVEITAALDAAPVADVAVGASTAATAVAATPARADLLGRTYGRSAPGRENLSPEPRWEEPASQSSATGRRPGATPSGTGHANRNPTLPSDRLAPRRPQDGQSAGAAAWLASLPAVSDRLGTDSPTRAVAVEGAVANQGVSDNPAVETSAAADTNQQSAPVLRRLRQIEDAVRHMSRHSSSFELPPEVARLGERLRRVGVCEDVTRALLPKVLRRVQEEDLDNREAVVTAAAELLYEQLPERADLRIGRERKVVAFVGPSGSGKTTAIAKIAAGFVRRRSRRPEYKEGEIVIVSTDTQRVGALAQARAYADLIGVPLEDAHDAQDLARILAHHDKARLILIDTAGIGPHEVKQREQLRALLSTAVVDEVQVVLDGRTSYDHMLDIIEVCDGEQPRRLLLSKMDEAMHPGAAVSAAIAGTMQSSFFTTGPAIPGGICPGDLRRLVDWVVGRCPSPFAPDGSHSSKTADN